MTRSFRLFWAPLLLVLLACQGSGDLPLDQVDPNAVAADPTFDQVNAIIHRSCVPCHTGEGEDEAEFAYGAGGRVLADDAPGLETCLDIVVQRFSIMEQVDANLMPPGAWPRLTSEEKLTIQRWIDNGAPAPCN